MPRRRRLPPDTRPNWRDPNMPVMRDYVMRDGTKRTQVDPDYEHRYREFLITLPDDTHPNWRLDPTYDLKKQRKKL